MSTTLVSNRLNRSVESMSVFSIGVEVIADGFDGPHDDSAVGRVADLAARLERSGVTYWVIGAGRDERAQHDRHPVRPTSVALDPTTVATVAARHTSSLGLVVAAAVHRDHPYNLARRLVSVDHAARGRVGWLALDADHATALNADSAVWTDAELATAHTTDAVAAVRALWRTWPLASVVGDRTTGVFADTARIRRADVAVGYAIAGPLNVPGSRQGDLPVWRTGEAAGADVLVVEEGEDDVEKGRVPDRADIPVVVRVRSNHVAAVARLAADGRVAGAVLRLSVADLDRVLDGVAPDAGLVAETTLRQRLQLNPPTEPDMSVRAQAFTTPPNPGARL